MAVGLERFSVFRTITVAVLIIRVIVFLFLLLGFTLDLSQSIAIVSVEVFVMEVAFLTVLPNFVEVVHVELNGVLNTCLTKEE